MSKLTFPDMTSDASAIGSFIASFIASVTLAEWSVLAGIVTALVTCAANVAYMRRKDAREQRQAELAEREAMARLERGCK
ncbi:hypothetical protein [Massilia niabensis]|uniref:Holin n=1 Tax=Massilia niabensis TaxID=544910 RepID=A0ABW0L2B1_9BURK